MNKAINELKHTLEGAKSRITEVEGGYVRWKIGWWK